MPTEPDVDRLPKMDILYLQILKKSPDLNELHDHDKAVCPAVQEDGIIDRPGHGQGKPGRFMSNGPDLEARLSELSRRCTTMQYEDLRNIYKEQLQEPKR